MQSCEAEAYLSTLSTADEQNVRWFVKTLSTVQAGLSQATLGLLAVGSTTFPYRKQYRELLRRPGAWGGFKDLDLRVLLEAPTIKEFSHAARYTSTTLLALLRVQQVPVTFFETYMQGGELRLTEDGYEQGIGNYTLDNCLLVQRGVNTLPMHISIPTIGALTMSEHLQRESETRSVDLSVLMQTTDALLQHAA